MSQKTVMNHLFMLQPLSVAVQLETQIKLELLQQLLIQTSQRKPPALLGFCIGYFRVVVNNKSWMDKAKTGLQERKWKKQKICLVNGEGIENDSCNLKLKNFNNKKHLTVGI